MPIEAEDIDDNPKSYGSRGQNWHPAFVEYMKTIVLHPNFEGMPDAIKPDGKIQWEAPSNRRSGVYQNTHHRRREWWRAQAAELGLDKHDDWISRVAKRIHPTGVKPCKRCGQVLRIGYAYPNAQLVRRARVLFGNDLGADPLEEIASYLTRLVDQTGLAAMDKFPDLLQTTAIQPPHLGRELDAWLIWIEDEYLPAEPSLLSPGAMSNAPDRFDGFHSFNRCCRPTADTGRHAANLRSYTTDRRVFEFWSEGDWIAADRMMGLVRAQFQDAECADGGEGPTADHIGPLSLGFLHRPEFRILSRAANSAKNNRMRKWDVDFLIRREAQGERVVSWYADSIWNLLKGKVHDDETALRVSKIMRDNQRAAMLALATLFQAGHTTFLATLLNLEFAESNVEFVKPAIEDHVTTFASVVRTPRSTKYTAEQKSRRIRIGFEALRGYATRTNRHLTPIADANFDAAVKLALEALACAPAHIAEMNARLMQALQGSKDASQEQALRILATQIPRLAEVRAFLDAMYYLKAAMDVVANNLGAMWEHERFVRAEFPFE